MKTYKQGQESKNNSNDEIQLASPASSSRSASSSIKSQNQQPQTQGQESKNSSNNEIQLASPSVLLSSASSSIKSKSDSIEIFVRNSENSLSQDQKNDRNKESAIQNPTSSKGKFVFSLLCACAGISGTASLAVLSGGIVPIAASATFTALSLLGVTKYGMEIVNSNNGKKQNTDLSKRDSKEKVSENIENIENIEKTQKKSLEKNRPVMLEADNTTTAFKHVTIDLPEELKLEISTERNTDSVNRRPSSAMYPTSHEKIADKAVRLK